MPAPGEIVHVELRRIGHLHEKYLVRWNGADRRQIRPARKNMEGIENEADGRMVRAPHDFPGIAIIVDVTPPREGLESHAHAALGGPLAEFVKISRCTLDPAER